MLSHEELEIDGHSLVALALNPQSAGEPIILLHGINLSPHLWLTDEVFVRHGPCYALSLPGHVPARFPPGFGASDLTAERIAGLLARAIRQVIGDRPVTLAGMSTGGFAALAIAALEPQLARRVISISGFAQGRWTGGLGLYQWLVRRGTLGRQLFRLGFWYGNRTHKSLRDDVWPLFVADKRALFAYPRFEELMHNLYPYCHAQDMQAVMTYYKVMPGIDITEWLPRITAPTLVLAGESDPIVPPAQSRLIAERVPNATLTMLPGAGHILFAERPVEYTRVIDSWLRQTL